MSIQSKVTFILNDKQIEAEVSPTLVLLDYLRKGLSLTGSKEGCKEGDCGACSVILGETENGTLRYRPITSCLLPMGELHGKHVVSVEGLSEKELSPIQSALVQCGGTQCGYCTPGFAVAMTAGLMDESVPLNDEGADYAISGNLCRCTGYRSIKQAGRETIASIKPLLEGKERIAGLCEAGALPEYFKDIPARLDAIPPAAPTADKEPPFIAGGTDLFVQQGEELPHKKATLLNGSDKKPIRTEDAYLVTDARESFESFARHPLIIEAIPAVAEYNDAIASWPIRERASLGGNICNASPIADMTSLLLAIETEVEISGSETEPRWLPLKDFYLGYKQLAKKPDEFLSSIRFPVPKPNEVINWEKVSKRRVLDIATVNSAAKIEVSDGIILSANLSLGGVAATPLYLAESSQALSGLPLSVASIAPVIEAAQSEFAPIGDVRGEAIYKRLLARQLLWAHFEKLFPEKIDLEAMHEALR